MRNLKAIMKDETLTRSGLGNALPPVGRQSPEVKPSRFELHCCNCGSFVSFPGYEGTCPGCGVQIRVETDWNQGLYTQQGKISAARTGLHLVKAAAV